MVWILALVLLLTGCSGEAVEGIVGTEVVEASEALPSGSLKKDGWVTLDGGSFSTKYNKRIKNRSHNLGLAASALDGAEVGVGGVFSFNDTVGVATWGKGYRPAQIFVRGREEKGIGGGVCQLSSTLYNAVLGAGLEVVERHPHSKRVFYVEEGKDAAIYYGVIDFRFRNTAGRPIKIEAKVEDGVCLVEIKGKG
jgi:vancomycin resistance protein YoaR